MCSGQVARQDTGNTTQDSGRMAGCTSQRRAVTLPAKRLSATQINTPCYSLDVECSPKVQVYKASFPPAVYYCKVREYWDLGSFLSGPHLPQGIQAFSTGRPCTDGAAASNGGQRAWTQTPETLRGNKPFFLLSELPQGFCHSHKKWTQAFL